MVCLLCHGFVYVDFILRCESEHGLIFLLVDIVFRSCSCYLLCTHFEISNYVRPRCSHAQVCDLIRYGKLGEAVDAVRQEKSTLSAKLSAADCHLVIEAVLEDSFIRIARHGHTDAAGVQFQKLAQRQF